MQKRFCCSGKRNFIGKVEQWQCTNTESEESSWSWPAAIGTSGNWVWSQNLHSHYWTKWLWYIEVFFHSQIHCELVAIPWIFKSCFYWNAIIWKFQCSKQHEHVDIAKLITYLKTLTHCPPMAYALNILHEESYLKLPCWVCFTTLSETISWN